MELIGCAGFEQAKHEQRSPGAIASHPGRTCSRVAANGAAHAGSDGDILAPVELEADRGGPNSGTSLVGPEQCSFLGVEGLEAAFSVSGEEKTAGCSQH